MSVTYGFYNSLNGDRRYNASQFSDMLDCLIVDGVFASIGTALVVKAGTDRTVNIGIGKAWFNHTWTLNDAILPMEVPEAEVLLDRIDAVVLEVNNDNAVRANSFKVITGKGATSPVRPTLIDDGTIHQHALCYIYRKAGSSQIVQSDITNVIGTKETPFVTGILKTVSLDELLGQWQSELDQFITNKTTEIDEWTAKEQTEFDEWTTAKQAEFNDWVTTKQMELDDWTATEQAEFEAWFENLETQLSGDVAGNLQVQINQINRKIKSSIAYITLYADKWNEYDDIHYSQDVTINGITTNSKIDLQPDTAVFTQMFEDDVAAMYIENNNGTITVYAIEAKPTVDLTIQVTVTDTTSFGEISYDEVENDYGTTVVITTEST